MWHMDMRERIQRANIASYAAWNSHDADGVAAIFAPDAEIIDISSGITTCGREAIRAVAANRLAGFPDFSLERRMMLIDGNTNSDQWIMRATHTGEYMGLEPTGRAVEICGATFSEFNDHGLVVRDTHYIDVPAMLRQLGLD